MKNFQGKVAAISGAGSGIGQQLAILLAQQGCHLSLSDISLAGLQQTLALLKESTVKISTHMVDVAEREQVQYWAEQTVREHGQVNLIFNNAGVALASTVEGASYEDLTWITNINFWGVVYGTKEFLPYIKQTQEGHIVNISSIFGIAAQPTQSAYNASKFAVRGFTEALRQELDIQRCGVSALCVHPGGVRTNIAKSARSNQSLKTLGIETDGTQQDFEKLLRTPPEKAAKQILKAIRRNQRRVLIGADAKILDFLQRLFPAGYQRFSVCLNRLQTWKD
ncbi:SDR family NAD(P)-dependent oxidoreductase [Acinetobacter brisouii]|uniref:SDR family NAD(P)-dependent oxidoreductase n=1 Tax=Acinetobacter brisouii TaxID=396323 RepID=UPI00124F1ADA|nr:SDR family NAD(P)-dependent oxidoreductase [Acinetobacter brisouii]